MHRVAAVLVALLALVFVPLLATAVIVRQPNATDYSAADLERLIAGITALQAVLGDATLGSNHQLSATDWDTYDFAVHTAQALTARGYDVLVVAAPNGSAGTRHWVLVSVDLDAHIGWVPVDPSPPFGIVQSTLGTVPLTADAAEALWFDAVYVTYAEEIAIESTSNQPPNAVIRTDHPKGVTNQKVVFLAVMSTDPDGQIVAYEWDLGDGATAAGRLVEHRFGTPGLYQVSLTVFDNLGASGTVVLDYSVKDPGGAATSGCGCGK